MIVRRVWTLSHHQFSREMNKVQGSHRARCARASPRRRHRVWSTSLANHADEEMARGQSETLERAVYTHSARQRTHCSHDGVCRCSGSPHFSVLGLACVLVADGREGEEREKALSESGQALPESSA